MLHILGKLLNNHHNAQSFIDVGVNLGQTMIKVKSILPSIKYIGFEPNPICVNYVNALIKANHFTDVEIIPAGISDKSSVFKLKLFKNSDVDSSASIIDDYRFESMVVRTMHVPVFRYDDIPMKKDVKAAIIKIDVEGAELEVLQGFKNKIAADRPVILLEILPANTPDNFLRVSRQQKIKTLLDELDYSILRVIKQKSKFIKVEHLTDFDIHTDLNLCDYVVIPSENVEDVLQKLNTAG